MRFKDTETFKQMEASFWDFDSTPNFDPISFFVKKEVQIDFAVPDNFEPSVGIVIK